MNKPIAVPVEEQESSEAFAMGKHNSRVRSGLENLPDSFHGSNLDGALRWDAQQQIVIEPDIRKLFDYFLGGYGEETIEEIRSRIQAYIDFHLPEPAAAQAGLILKNYLALQSHLAQFHPLAETPMSDKETIAQQLAEISLLRRQYLGVDVADAFFGEEEQYDQYTLKVMEIMNEPALSTNEKLEQQALLMQQLPYSVQESLRNSQQLIALDRLNQIASTEEKFQLRSNMLGTDAAQRLENLDLQRKLWQQRIQDWLVVHSQMMNTEGLAIADRKLQITHLRQQYFKPDELLRVQALERIHASSRNDINCDDSKSKC